ncbi:MAG: ATP-binding protein, partial [Propionibacteriaceae bacterium]|nr:ATP-binding protein [Propionibacteriaceae bacterium]
IVIRTHTLQLPSREELEHEHLFEQLGLEKIYGRALNALIAAIARHVCFRDTSVLAGFVVSEAHSMTISFEGERELVDFVRDGRKHRAVVLLDSHDPEADFGSPTLRGLIPTRILMRHRDKTLAKRGLAWLDLDPEDESLVEMVRHDTSPLAPGGKKVPAHRRGEATMRDMSGNVGRVKILLPARAERAAAIVAGGSAARRPVRQADGAQ